MIGESLKRNTVTSDQISLPPIAHLRNEKKKDIARAITARRFNSVTHLCRGQFLDCVVARMTGGHDMRGAAKVVCTQTRTRTMPNSRQGRTHVMVLVGPGLSYMEQTVDYTVFSLLKTV